MTQSKFPAPIKRKRGRPRFVPTDAQRERVVALKAVGATNETVAKILGIDRETLTANFQEEIETGVADILGQVVGTLFRQALAGDITACIFICKTRLGWSEKSRVEISPRPDNEVIYRGTDEKGRIVIVHSNGEVLFINTRDPDEYTEKDLIQLLEGEQAALNGKQS